ncbi:MAG: hypothetical protein EPN89_11810 [Methylovulum sp.]|nr:MAG: hypothetical protein EPN89_11810 [Methylovulum sp.]
MIISRRSYSLSGSFSNEVIVMQYMSGIVDVAIGLVFVYLLLSLICSSLTEMADRKDSFVNE